METGPPQLRTDLPHPARVYDYFLGGKTNFDADRQVAQEIAARLPSVPQAARANRAFLQRAVRFLAEQGIDQFLDIGTGIPTSPNVHEVAQAVNPAARVAYVDNDPIVLAHASALLASHPAGRTAYAHADLRDPQAVLAHPAVAGALDLSRPVGLLLVAVLHFLSDAEDPRGVVRALVGALAPGSAVVVSHATAEGFDPEVIQRSVTDLGRSGYHAYPRTRAEVLALLEGLELLPPGLVPVAAWQPVPPGEVPPPVPAGQLARPHGWAAVARKP